MCVYVCACVHVCVCVRARAACVSVCAGMCFPLFSFESTAQFKCQARPPLSTAKTTLLADSRNYDDCFFTTSCVSLMVPSGETQDVVEEKKKTLPGVGSLPVLSVIT